MEQITVKKILFIAIVFFISVVGFIGLTNSSSDGTFDESMQARKIAEIELDFLLNDTRVMVLESSTVMAKPNKNWMISMSFLFKGEVNDLRSLLKSRGWVFKQSANNNKDYFCKENILLNIQQELIEINNVSQVSYFVNLKFSPVSCQSALLHNWTGRTLFPHLLPLPAPAASH